MERWLHMNTTIYYHLGAGHNTLKQVDKNSFLQLAQTEARKYHFSLTRQTQTQPGYLFIPPAETRLNYATSSKTILLLQFLSLNYMTGSSLSLWQITIPIVFRLHSDTTKKQHHNSSKHLRSQQSHKDIRLITEPSSAVPD